MNSSASMRTWSGTASIGAWTPRSRAASATRRSLDFAAVANPIVYWVAQKYTGNTMSIIVGSTRLDRAARPSAVHAKPPMSAATTVILISTDECGDDHVDRGSYARFSKRVSYVATLGFELDVP